MSGRAHEQRERLAAIKAGNYFDARCGNCTCDASPQMLEACAEQMLALAAGVARPTLPLEQSMPPGTQFVYLGRPCMVLRHADSAESTFGDRGWFGLVLEYVDEHGVIRQHYIAPRDHEGFAQAIRLAPAS
jgi:hypothetical protein